MRRIYIMGSLRNPDVTRLSAALRDDGHEVFDDWFSPGPEADEFWRKYETERGRSYIEALNGSHAKTVFEFDRDNIVMRDTAILVLPAGRSGHNELGFAAGLAYCVRLGFRGTQMRETHILLDEAHDRWDVMYRFADHVWSDAQKMLEHLLAN